MRPLTTIMPLLISPAALSSEMFVGVRRVPLYTIPSQRYKQGADRSTHGRKTAFPYVSTSSIELGSRTTSRAYLSTARVSLVIVNLQDGQPAVNWCCAYPVPSGVRNAVQRVQNMRYFHIMMFNARTETFIKHFGQSTW